MQVCDRWTGEPLADVPLASPKEVDAIIGRAVAAFAAMRKTPGWHRRDALRKISSGLELRAEEFARTIAREAGKPIAQARAEVARAASTFLLASEEATRTEGAVLPLDVTPAATGYAGRWVRVPVGPVLGIAPFNFPLNLVAHKVAPALAVGASIVLKPPPQAPLTALALAELVRGVGLPEDALQVVPCDVPEAEQLVRDERFAVLSFTGSDRVGWHLKSIAGKKRVLLELGGNAAAVVHEDAPDLAFAAHRIVSGAFAYAGQVCIKVQRLYVHRPIAARFVAELVSRASALEPKSPLDDGAVLGPMIDEAAAARVDVWVEEALAMGARALLRGARAGSRLAPTILSWEGVGDGSGRGAKVVDEEVFGPVLSVHVYDDWDTALRMVDATRFGLQAGIFTDSLARVERAFDELHVGGLVVGDVPTFRVDHMPYGGTRDSGLGREGVRFAMHEMTETKLLVHRRGG
jgi:glyceraldehyde-3-phosphate dehydrogenase (NADP+)